MKKKVCIIGYNYSYKVLFNSFKISKRFNIIGIAGKKKRKINSLSDFKYYTSWIKMINELRPDIVAIGVPPREQEKILLFLLKKKIHFICEKPITDNFKKINLFKKLLVKKNTIKLVDLNFITIPAIQKFKMLLKKEKISKNTKISIDWYFKPKSLKEKLSWKNNKKKLGGELNNFFFHLVSVVYYLFGNFEITTIEKGNYYYNFLLKSKKISLNINFFFRSRKNLFKIYLKNKIKSISVVNRSKDYHNNYHINLNGKKIFRKNFPNSKSRIFATKKILDIFLNRKNSLKKHLDFQRGLEIQKKIINLI